MILNENITCAQSLWVGCAIRRKQDVATERQLLTSAGVDVTNFDMFNYNYPLDSLKSKLAAANDVVWTKSSQSRFNDAVKTTKYGIKNFTYPIYWSCITTCHAQFTAKAVGFVLSHLNSLGGYPLVLSDAAAAKTPALLADIGSLREVGQDLKLPMFDHQAISDLVSNVRNIYENFSLLTSIQQLMLVYYEKHLEPIINTQKLLSIIDRLLPND